jgi:hypothetical protein
MACVQRSVLIAFYLSINVALGGALQSEVLVWKPWSQVSKDLGRVALKSSYTLQPGQISVNSWNMNIPEINLHLESTALSQKIDPDSIHMQFNNMKLLIQIPSISINQTVEQVINGNSIRVHINSKCSSVALSNSALQIAAKLNWIWQEKFPNPVLENLVLNWSDETWEIPNFHCTGPIGIDAVLLNQIKTNLKDRNLIQSMVFEKIRTEIQNQWSTLKNQFLAGGGLVSATSTQHHVRFSRIAAWNQKGLAVIGILDSQVNIDNQDLPQTPLTLTNLDPESFETQKAVLPKSLLTYLAQSQIQTGKLEKINLRDNGGFFSLLRSRFLQFFFWPDLMSFKKTARFEILFSPFSKLKIQWPSKNVAHITGGLNAQVQAEKDSVLQPYIDIALGFSIQAGIQKNGQIISITSTKPSIDLNHRFNGDYIKRYQPAQHISSTIVKKGKAAVLEAVKIDTSIDLGAILGNGIQINEFEFDQDNIVIDWN